jgi:nitrate reductase molybdenum cofactor assembly chaperone NarJ/NarW
VTGDGQRLAYAIASTLLCYPDERVRGRLPDVVAALPQLPSAACRDPLAGVAAWLGGQPPGAAERHHVEVFDLTRRCSPYLTYYRYGDTRQRGMALLALKHTYRRAGVEPRGPELPDYLPVVLEFAALTGDPGVRVLDGNRAALQLMRLALHDLASPYAGVLDAVDATLPALSARQQEDVRRLAAEGPPKEDVGLDPVGSQPFAPPELLGMPGARP